MSKIEVVPYKQLNELTFENFMSSKINTELYLDIRYINNTSIYDERVANFKRKYNLRYLGEILERYEERGIVNTKEDLRTLLVFTVQSLYFEKPDINTNQLDVFISNIEKISSEEKDIFNIGVLLQSDSWVGKIVNDKELCEIILDELENNDNLSFEEKVWGIYSCWSYIKSNSEFKGDNLIERLSGLGEICEKLLVAMSGIEIEPLKHMEDYYLYLMLAKIANAESFFSKSKNFKKKSVCNQYKKLLSLVKKEYTRDTVKSLVPVLNIGEEELIYYNYMLSGYSQLASIDSKVTSKGDLRLCQAMLYSLCKNERCPSIILKQINEKIYRISQENDPERRRSYYTPTKGRDKAIEIVFKSFSGKISRENFSAFLDLTKARVEKRRFISSKHFYYLLENEYEDEFNEIYSYTRENLIELCLKDCKDINLVKRAFSLYNTLENKEELSVQQFKNLYSLGVIDSSTDYKYTSPASFKGYLEYLESIVSEDSYLEELKLVYSNIEEIERRVTGCVGKTDFVSSLNSIMESNLTSSKIERIAESDLELARRYQEFKDNLVFLTYSLIDYYQYIIDCIKNCKYKELMCLSDNDVSIISRNIYESLKELYDIENANYTIRRICADLEGMVLTDSEKEAKERAMREKLKKEKLDALKETSRIYAFDSILKSEFAEEESFVLSVKDIFITKVKEHNIIDDTYEIGRGYGIINKLIKKGLINDAELLEFAKICLKAV